MSNKIDQEKQHLLEIVREVVKHDNQLREKLGVGEKFRFIKDRLQALLEQVEKHVTLEETIAKQKVKGVGEDEVVVYVYLYNTQGIILKTWVNMLTPKLFYEYSINRPIYAEKKFIEDLIKNKTNRTQHAYLSVIVNKTAILPNENPILDAYQHPVLKVREGALVFEKLLLFTHNDVEYEFEDGEFKRK